MIITCKNNAANAAVGGKTARACDSCIKRRARWYCAADDAFLCQSCDFSVHSANPLARRHERVRLKTSSFKPTSVEITPPSWLKGFTKKARTRTRRHGKAKFDELHPQRSNPLPLVPEFGSDEVSHEENEEEQLLYRVPIYDPFSAELCTSSASNEAATSMVTGNDDVKMFSGNGCGEHDSDCLHGFFPSDMDIAEFAADVESLLGKGLEEEPFGMEELGLIDEEKELNYSMGSTGKVKVEDEEDCHKLAVDDEVDIARETFELNFDYESPLTCEEEDDNQRIIKEDMSLKSAEDDSSNKKERKILLTLDYEAVMTAWASQGSPWTTGDRPDIDPDECWPDYLGADGTELLQHPYGGYIGIGTHTAALGDGGREARVSRYREKRRTRLFSKKIRYEVRKLNAEKRPRMKGRFVKRTSFAAAPPAFPLLSK